MIKDVSDGLYMCKRIRNLHSDGVGSVVKMMEHILSMSSWISNFHEV